ncbi:phage antirepressor protein [Candidatus Falkowbacteria bacterium CG_4_10_14_0_8_um_filter_41_36]|uniref:Phage antirepressor protein n=3 Tax=Candidatus Falkowiibacteriota TaxID=1752728 RepID=A0A1J4T7C0_9BACT|nr:MAG: phage antirepressor protein [Candidatus Falkowbacteria bacterium CG1_02_41_21]PIZ11606.1 MAG: phage antirepressor protein [Candidatus Falkowbacteria bacterium CG_4_10_14_0_8_um_filter_41_36]
MNEELKQIALFQGKKIRKTIYQKEWWFSVIDVVQVLIDQPDNYAARKYWNKLAQRSKEEGSELVTICHRLKLMANDGKKYETDCANTEGLFRIIQSIPSPKAEPLKRWLAKVGYERVQEIENPELATKRTKLLYKLKGYPEDWIEKRMLGITVRGKLTDEWQKRGAQVERDFEILTAEISQATFGLKPNEHKKLKGLKRENLRDHMDNLELVLTMLGETTTTELHRTNDSKGVPRLKDDARVGGQIAGSARKQIERKLGRSIVSKNNFLLNKPKELK